MSEFESQVRLYQHEDLIVAGASGEIIIPNSILTIREPLEDCYRSIHLSPVVRGSNGDAIYGFNPDSRLLWQIYSHPENVGSIIGVGTNKPKLLEEMEFIVAMMSLDDLGRENRVWEDFFQSQAQIHKDAYIKTKGLAQFLEIPLEKAFGVVTYGHILQRHSNLSFQDAAHTAAEQLRIDLGRKRPGSN